MELEITDALAYTRYFAERHDDSASFVQMDTQTHTHSYTHTHTHTCTNLDVIVDEMQQEIQRRCHTFV